MMHLRDESGFSLAEQLFTIIIVGLLGVIVAAGVGVTTRTYTNVRDVADTHSILNDAATVISDELRFAYDIVPVNTSAGGTGTISSLNTGVSMGQLYAFDSVAQNARICLVNSMNTSGEGNIRAQTIVPSDITGGVETQANSLPGGATATNSSEPLVIMPNNSDVSVQITSLNYDNNAHMWTVELTAYKAPVWSGTEVSSSAYTASTGPIQVRSLN